MFGLGFTELLLIFIVALLVFGPEKLPEIAKNLGKAIGTFRATFDDIRRDVYVAERSLKTDFDDVEKDDIKDNSLEKNTPVEKNENKEEPQA